MGAEVKTIVLQLRISTPVAVLNDHPKGKEQTHRCMNQKVKLFAGQTANACHQKSCGDQKLQNPDNHFKGQKKTAVLLQCSDDQACCQRKAAGSRCRGCGRRNSAGGGILDAAT